VSHPAILHHFGSREGLVAAVVRHSMQELTAQLMAVFSAASTERVDRRELVELVANVCGEGGLARLLAFLLLESRDSRELSSGELPLKQLADAAHELRQRLGQQVSYEDTLFEVQLLAIALLGDALFGDAVRSVSGVAPAEEGVLEFRRRLTMLLSR
jgi:AcrR family transcriptional regulator